MKNLCANGLYGVDKHGSVKDTQPRFAQVAELVDALASGASDRKVVEVRVFSWAPSFFGNLF